MFSSRFLIQASLIGLVGLGSSILPMTFSPTPAIAQTATNSYNTYMQRGYSLTARRLYQDALINFRRALQARPGDRYASVALNNVEAYIARDRMASRPGQNRLAYIPSNLGMPGNTVAGGTRGTCVPGEVPLTALSPKTNLVLTASETPELFFYLPTSQAQTTELLLIDEAGNIVDQRMYSISGTPGIARIKLNQGRGLEVGKKYRWSLSLVCNPADPSGNPFVQGWVERVDIDPNMLQAINSTPAPERLPLYAANQIWSETLATMVQLQQQNPNNSELKGQWVEFLAEAGVSESIAKMPLVECCQAQ